VSDEQPPEELDDEQVVLIRIVEWTEWIPGTADKTLPQLQMHNGFTGVVTSRTEKLIDVGISGTGKNMDWTVDVECPDCEGTGKIPPTGSDQFKPVEQTPPLTDGEIQTCQRCEGGGFIAIKVHYGLYAFQATLAQNVSENLYRSLKLAQDLPIIEENDRRKEQGRDKRDDLVIVERKSPPPPPPKRRKRK
jgi:hypothetical protein